MKVYLSNSDLSLVTESKYLLEVVQASLEITDSSSVYKESLLVSSFLSTITVRNSQLSDISFEMVSLSIVSSTLIMENSTISDVTGISKGANLISANSGTVNVSSLEYSSSNVRLLDAFGSEVNLESLNLTDLVIPNEIISIFYCSSFYLRDVALANVILDASFIMLTSSDNIIVEDITLTDLGYIFMELHNSNATKIHNLQVSNGTEVLKVVSSNVQTISNCLLASNSKNTSGGAISIDDSEVKIFDSTFRQNSAINGGAIYFHCSSTSN